jgi:hypothetical protein
LRQQKPFTKNNVSLDSILDAVRNNLIVEIQCSSDQPFVALDDLTKKTLQREAIRNQAFNRYRIVRQPVDLKTGKLFNKKAAAQVEILELPKKAESLLNYGIKTVVLQACHEWMHKGLKVTSHELHLGINKNTKKEQTTYYTVEAMTTSLF